MTPDDDLELKLNGGDDTIIGRGRPKQYSSSGSLKEQLELVARKQTEPKRRVIEFIEGKTSDRNSPARR